MVEESAAGQKITHIKKKLKKFLLLILYIIILLMLITTFMYLWVFANNSDFFFLQEKFLMRYAMFNLIFLANFLLLLHNKLSKYWYLVYVFQLLVVVYLNRRLLVIIDLADIICFYCVGYIFLLIGYVFFEKAKFFFSTRYEKGIVNQNKFYGTILKKNHLLNNLVFLRNVFIIRLESSRVPENPSRGFWIFYTILFLLVGFLSAIFAYKTIFAMALFCFSVNAQYESLYFNYRDSIEFKKNFDLNTRFWLIKLSNNNYSEIGVVTKRWYAGPGRESIKVVAENLGSVSITNPRARTLFVIGGGLFFAGVAATTGFVAKTYVQESAITERYKITMEEEKEINNKRMEAEKEINDKRLAMEKYRQEQKTERARLKTKYFWQK